ncbi:MAG TPA: 4Fe-4S binding protein, partial [Spirochaetales bacterium]|nr:4Fe-4S binding protein [Spirochaetales bacterium]
MTRTLIEINEDLCDGCGLCANGCHEGALRIIDGKARLVGESLCDGLGACIGDCPRGALKTVQREAEEYSERRVIENILPKGMNTVMAHLEHLKSHGQDSWYNEALAILKEKGMSIPSSSPAAADSGCGCGSGGSGKAQAKPGFSAVRTVDNGMSGGCPGSAARSFSPAGSAQHTASSQGRPAQAAGGMSSRLEQWPVQLHLINPRAPYFQGADILIAADCTAFACGAFHQALLAGRKLVIACPKLDS